MKPIARFLCLFALLVAAAGCLSSSGGFVGAIYYTYGPEAALEAADYYDSPPGGNALVELERSTALMELGWYRESLSALRDARSLLEVEDALVSSADDRRPPWRPEGHEAVLLATMEMANSLALQDAAAGSAAADRAVEEMASADCSSCSFNFTRTVAALAFEAAGRYSDGTAVVSGVVVTGRGGEMVDGIRRRLSRGLAGAQPEGLAPPPVDEKRSVVFLLLMGRGPTKVSDELKVDSSETIRWARYMPTDPQAVSWAALELDGEKVSAELTDVDELAAASLRARAERTVAARGAGIDPKRRDLRHWVSLPATMQMVVAEIPVDADSTDLVYTSPDGDEVARETVEWPASWTDGRIFVVRRVP